MASRPIVALALGAAAYAAAGCADQAPPAEPGRPAGYVEAVQRLVDPPSRLAATASEALAAGGDPAPADGRAAELVRAARERLERFRALRLADPGLRRQRDRIAGAYARLVPRMRALASALEAGDRARARAAAGPFFASLRSLSSAARPSAASSSSSR